MTATVAGIHLGLDTHANRPAGNSCPDGSLYSCSTHNLVYKSNFAGNSWATWGTMSGGTGSVATDTIWDAAGDLVQGTGADAAAKLSAGTAGQFLKAGGASTAVAWASMQLDYAEFTSNVGPTATTEATANTIVTGNSVAYDGATPIMIEFFSPASRADSAAAGRSMLIWLYDGSSSIGALGQLITPAASGDEKPIHMFRRLTPSNASHTYSVRGSVSAGTGSVNAGAGGTGNFMPGFIRITRAT